MKNIVIIPARMGSSRFPGKPLEKIHGMPMIGHIYHRCLQSTADEVYVATCDEIIAEYIKSIGGNTVMTSDQHERASERTSEALEKIEKDTGQQIEVVAMVQGDEPMLTPNMIDSMIQPFEDPEIKVVNLMADLLTPDEQDDVNEVKVVVDLKNFAMYFSREAIPSRKREPNAKNWKKQLGLISFRKQVLQDFNRLKPTPLEIIESVDMLRLLENGIKVKMIHTGVITYSVDTLEDLEVVVKEMENDPLMKSYCK